MSNYWLSGVHAIDSLTGAKTPEQIQRERAEANARSADAGISIVQGINNVPRAVSGLVTAGQWHDSNPFEQFNNYLETKKDNGHTYTPGVLDNLIQWGIQETPQILVGKGLASLYNRYRQANNLFYKPTNRFAHPIELMWNATAEVGKGLTDPNVSTQDAFINGALNLTPGFGNNKLVKTGLGLGSEMLEVDNSYNNEPLFKQWGIQ